MKQKTLKFYSAVFLSLSLFSMNVYQAYSQNEKPENPSVIEEGDFKHCVILCQASTYFDCVLYYTDGTTQTCRLQQPRYSIT